MTRAPRNLQWLSATPARLRHLVFCLVGELNFHGVKKTVSVKYGAKRTGSDYHVHGTTSINLADFKIEQPSFAGVHTGMTAEVKVKFKLRE